MGWLAFVALLASIACGLATDRAVTMSIAVTGCIAAMLLTQLERVREFRLGGLKAKLDKVERARREAVATLTELRSVALTLGRLGFETLSRIGLFGAFPTERRLGMRDQLVRELRRLGVPSGEIASATYPVTRVVRHQHCNRIKELTRAADKDSPQTVDERFAEVVRWDAREPASVEAVIQAAGSTALAEPEVAEALADLKHFDAHGTLRRPEVWRES